MKNWFTLTVVLTLAACTATPLSTRPALGHDAMVVGMQQRLHDDMSKAPVVSNFDGTILMRAENITAPLNFLVYVIPPGTGALLSVTASPRIDLESALKELSPAIPAH